MAEPLERGRRSRIAPLDPRPNRGVPLAPERPLRVRFVVREALPEGGLTLAVFRLAQALLESGHDARVVFSAGDPPAGMDGLGSRLDGADAPLRNLARALEREDPDVVLVSEDSIELLRSAAAVAPTLLHTHVHWGVCPDEARYWNRVHRPCAVRAGWHCVALRPLLGCSSRQRTLDPRYVAAQQKLLALLTSGDVGVVTVSTDQAQLFAAHGVPRSRTLVMPNLGIHMKVAELDQVASETPEQWRSAVTFIGRLDKAKGAALLPAFARSLGPQARLRVFGDGYLAAKLAVLPPEVKCGHISQREVAGVLMWAQAVLFPSLWPEPGGIVGIDAQVMGVPLAAFDTGAARHWPQAARFARGDIAAMGAWIASQPPRRAARDPELTAARQAGYRARIAEYASRSLQTYVRTGAFEQTGTVEQLMAPNGVPVHA